MSANQRHIVAVMLPDRVGALRDVTAVIVRLGGDIGGIRQTVVDGFFSLVFVSEHPADIPSAAIQEALVAGLEAGAGVMVRRYDAPPPPPLPAAGARYVAITRGRDRPGTIHAISAFFVEQGVNIEDWQAESEGEDVTYTAQVMLPASADCRAMQEAFRTRMSERALAATMIHENIFRATNEVGPIKSLLRG